MSVVDGDGDPIVGPIPGGSQFFLTAGNRSEDERYDDASVTATVTATGTFANRVAARALNTDAGSRETLTVLGIASANATDTKAVQWSIAPDLAPSLAIDGSGAAGSTLSIAGGPFHPNEPVQVQVADGEAITVAADGSGQITQSWPVPWSAGDGAVSIVATGTASGRAAAASHTLQAAPAPILSLSADELTAGDDVSVTGAGFAPNEPISVELHSDAVVLGALAADASGNASGAFTVPTSVPADAHTVWAAGGVSGLRASASLTVKAVPVIPDPMTPGTPGPGPAQPGTGGENPDPTAPSTGGSGPGTTVIPISNGDAADADEDSGDNSDETAQDSDPERGRTDSDEQPARDTLAATGDARLLVWLIAGLGLLMLGGGIVGSASRRFTHD